MADRRPASQTSGLSRAAQDALRREVARFRRREQRRSFPPVVYVGRPAGSAADFVDLAHHSRDHGLRTEVLTALLARVREQTPSPVTWLTRSGSLDTEDVDLAWYAAARSAYGEAGVPLAMVVITRAGWYDPRGGARREWKRLRLRG